MKYIISGLVLIAASLVIGVYLTVMWWMHPDLSRVAMVQSHLWQHALMFVCIFGGVGSLSHGLDKAAQALR